MLNIEKHITIFKNNEIDNLNQYLLYKFILGIQIRYNFEKNLYLKFTDEDKDKWNNIKNKKERNLLIEKYNKNQYPSFNINFLTHWNSLNINRIMEIPIKKLKYVLKSIKKEF